MIETLAHAAGATKQRQPQLNSLLDWLQYAGLIDARGAHVTLTNARPQSGEIGGGENEGDKSDATGSERAGEQTPGGSASAGTTKSQRRSPPPSAPLASCAPRARGHREHGGSMSPSQVIAALNAQDAPTPKSGAIHNMMGRLVREGDLVREGGQYDLPGRNGVPIDEVPFVVPDENGTDGSLSTTPPFQEAT